MRLCSLASSVQYLISSHETKNQKNKKNKRKIKRGGGRRWKEAEGRKGYQGESTARKPGRTLVVLASC